MTREYRDSGIEWIGQIPKEWEVVPFKAYFTTGKGLSFTKADLTPQGHAVVSYGQVHSKVNTGTRLDDSLLRYIPDSITENGESSRMNKGDFIFADTSEDLEGCGNCVYVDRDIELYAGYHSVTAKPKVQYDNKYFAYYFQTPCWRSQIRSRVTGIKVYSISQSIINKTHIFVPSLSEQQKIANYLDKICGEVDELVAIQETMIEELKAYKQSVITEAVTKGLNPKVPMRNSGIDWIGEIPEHWEVQPFKWILRKPLQYGANESGVLYDDSLPRYVRITDILNNSLREDLQKQSLTDEQAEGYILEDDDILFARSGGTVGKAFIYKKEYGRCAFAGYLIRAQIKAHCCPNYVYYYTQSQSYDEWKRQIFIQATIQNIGADRYSLMELPVPPLSEQRTIASYLDTKCSEIDALIALKQAKIDELKEYKKSVIYEYVTGKKEVC